MNLLEKEQIARGIPFGYPEFAGSDRDAKDNRHRSKYVLDIIKNAETSRISLEEQKTQIEWQYIFFNLKFTLSIPINPIWNGIVYLCIY